MPVKKNKSEIETELKIRLSPEDMEKVFSAFTYKGGASKVSHKFLPRMYYDTADMRLYKNNISLRIQYKTGKAGELGGYEQTVKLELEPESAIGKGVLFRKECKNTLKSHKPDLSAVTDPQALDAIRPFKSKKLEHIFTTAIERRFFDLKVKSGTVEIAFDTGQIILPHNNRHLNFSEIEVEIKRGGHELIDIVKDKIMSIAPSAKIQPLSKSAQGSRFYLKHKK